MKRTQKRSSSKWLFVVAALAVGVVLAYAMSGGNVSEAKESPFNADRAARDLATLVGFGPRPAGSEAIARSRAYIVEELRKAGLEPILDEFEAVTPRGRKQMVNIRAIREGAQPRVIALAGHYDTKIFNFNFVGANDGGSSAAWVLEMARATKDLQLSNTLEFIFFDGEEAVVEWTDTDSVYGSRYDVDRRYRGGELNRLKALILVDMIGDRDLNIRKESESTDWLTNTIWSTAQQMGFRREFLNDEIAVADDHIPFLKAGVNAVDIIDFDYPYWHTAGDTLDKTSGASLKIVGDVIYNCLPDIDKRVSEMN
jgi:Zn-dependent M28 family amino/carboxypeptidase